MNHLSNSSSNNAEHYNSKLNIFRFSGVLVGENKLLEDMTFLFTKTVIRIYQYIGT